MEIICAACGQTTTIQQDYPFNAGFSSRGFLYCDSNSAILEFDTYNARYTALVGDKHPWSLNSEEKACVESALKPYAEGGNFLFGALPRCPKCNATLPELLDDEMHFVEIGKVIDADKEDVWL